MKKIIFLPIFFILFIIVIFTFYILKELNYQVSPISNTEFKSIVLTNTHKDKLFKETAESNPYVFGWEGDTVYYKDVLGNTFAYNAATGEKRSKTINKQYFKQEMTKCNYTSLPTFYDHAIRRNQWDDQDVKVLLDGCKAASNNGTVLEAWMLITSELFEGPRRILVIKKDNREIIIDERRLFADATISEDGKYLALTLSDPVEREYPPPDFNTPTNIFIISLDQSNTCQPPQVNWTKQNMGEVNLDVIGKVEKKDEQVFQIKFLKSNKFWDESDTFTQRGQTIPVYRVAGDEKINEGDTVLVRVNHIYWDANYVTKIGECSWTYKTLQASSIIPSNFDLGIVAIESLKNSFGLIILLPFLIAFILIKLAKTK